MWMDEPEMPIRSTNPFARHVSEESFCRSNTWHFIEEEPELITRNFIVLLPLQLQVEMNFLQDIMGLGCVETST